MSNARIASTLFALLASCALIAMAWHQTHGSAQVWPASGFIAAAVMVLALTRALYATVRCFSKEGCAKRAAPPDDAAPEGGGGS